MPALADLIVPLTKDQVTATQIALLQAAGLPTTSWQSGSVPLTLLQVDAQILADLSTVMANVTAGGFVQLASQPPFPEPSPFLDLIAQSHYALTRKPGTVTQGAIRLTDFGGGGPYTIAISQLFAVSSNGLRFVNTSGGTLPKNGTLTVTVQAESAGAAYNVANGVITSLATPLPGVAVANPDPGSGTWITQQGSDAETNASLAARCTQRWSTLGGGAPVAAYQYWAVTSTPSVTRVNVLENTPSGGQVTLYLAGSNGASSAADVASVNTYVQAVRPLCVTVNVLPALNRVVTLQGSVTVAAASRTTAIAQFATALNAYALALPVGATVVVAKIVALLMGCAGVTNVSLTLPAGDTVLGPNEVATFTNALTFVGV